MKTIPSLFILLYRHHALLATDLLGSTRVGGALLEMSEVFSRDPARRLYVFMVIRDLKVPDRK
jgi:hypothetical protein